DRPRSSFPCGALRRALPSGGSRTGPGAAGSEGSQAAPRRPSRPRSAGDQAMTPEQKAELLKTLAAAVDMFISGDEMTETKPANFEPDDDVAEYITPVFSEWLYGLTSPL